MSFSDYAGESRRQDDWRREQERLEKEWLDELVRLDRDRLQEMDRIAREFLRRMKRHGRPGKKFVNIGSWSSLLVWEWKEDVWTVQTNGAWYGTIYTGIPAERIDHAVRGTVDPVDMPNALLQPPRLSSLPDPTEGFRRALAIILERNGVPLN